MNPSDHLYPGDEPSVQQNHPINSQSKTAMNNSPLPAFARAAAEAAPSQASPIANTGVALVTAADLENLQLLEENETASKPTAKVTPNDLVIYACGGTGINLGRKLEALLKSLSTAAMARIKVCYIDSSDANVRGATMDNLYIFGNGKGSGGDRAVNIEPAKNASSDILEKFPPSQTSIFLTGLSGGTGSAIAPTLCGRLMRRGIQCVTVGVVSSASVREIQNTLDTLASYERIPVNTEIPTIMAPFHNEQLGGEKRADAAALSTVLLLANLCSGLNDRLDDMDVHNFFDYRTSSPAPIKLMGLITDSATGEVYRDNQFTVVATATLASNPDSQAAPEVFDNQTVGFYPKSIGDDQPTVHFMVVDGLIQKLHTRLEEDLTRIEAASSARAYHKPVATFKEPGGDDDVVLHQRPIRRRT